MATAPAQRIPRNLRVLLAANFVSCVGSGLTLPFLLIYLHEVRHISLGITGLLIGFTSVVAVPVGPASGTLVDRFGPRFVCAGALAFAAVGTVALVLVRSPLSALPVLFVYGVANGATWPTWNALFAVMVHDESLRPRVFARSFQLLNLGLGAGAVIAGFVVHVSHPSSFDLIYVVDGVTYLSVVVALMLLPASAFHRAPVRADEERAHPRGGYREVLADRRFLRYLVATSLLFFAGYAAVNAGLVGYATVVVHAQPYVIAWAFAVNTALIVMIQPLALRVVGLMRRSTALSICALIFATSWVILAVSGLFPRTSTGNALIVAMFFVFALGEVMLSPTGAPLVSMMARPGLQGRYMALSSSIFTVANVLGPAIAGAMLGAGLGDEYLGILVGFAAAAIVAFQWMRRSLSPEIDNARSYRSGSGSGAQVADKEPETRPA
ncbi:MAG: MFS transporter [Acidimicrobiales bacterium]